MKKITVFVSYILVFVLGACSAIMVFDFLPEDNSVKNTVEQLTQPKSKLTELADLIEERFIAESDRTAMEDAAADAMVNSLGDEWSHYISARDYDAYMEQMQNAYVGVGITISLREDGYLDVLKVESGGPAEEAGILAGDILIAANGLDCAELGMDETRNVVRGEEGTTVELTLKRGEQEMTLTVMRKYFEVTVAELKFVKDGIGLIAIYNFDDRCAKETIEAIESALSQGAEKLIFDVRNNPGGYKHELVEILDYLLPAGPLFRSVDYAGVEEVDESDRKCLDVPMAVLVNIESYSAAEFFAAAMADYDAAVIVGSQTYGKGYFQQTFRLEDGSAVGLSVGKYFTPNGVSLAGVGLTPDVVVEVDEEMFLDIYYGNLDPMEDPQILAAMEALKLEN